MSDPSAGFLEFALKAWHNRHYVMQAQGAEARTRRIYNYYNYFDCIRDTGLCSVLEEIELQFQKCANLKFYFQSHRSVKLSGNSIAEMAGYLNELLDKDSSKLVLLQKQISKQHS